MEISSAEQIKKFFDNIDAKVENFLNFFDFKEIDYKRAMTDTGENIFLASIPVVDNDKYYFLIEKLDDKFNIQIRRFGRDDDDNDDDDVIVDSDSFIGRKCAILLTMAQCKYCNSKLYFDIEEKKQNICYM